jgi:hypothetical protein
VKGILSKAVSRVILALYLTGMLASTFAMTSGNWVQVKDTVTGYYGEAVIGTGDCIYIARRSNFYRYNPVDNSWTALAAPPNPDAGDAFKTGTALAWDFSDHIYALYGAATSDSRKWFYRYSISSNSWQALANTTADQGEGDATAWCGLDDCIYATIGGEQRPTYLVRYHPSTNNWSDAPKDPPEGMGDGASLVWTGGSFLYALRGEYLEEEPLYDFWRYSLVNDTWESMADIPAYPYDEGEGGVGDGGSLLYVGFWLQNQTDCIYALGGNQAYPEGTEIIPDRRFYRYTLSTGSWEQLADLSFGIGCYVGCRLGYAGGHIYAWQGAPSTWAGDGDDLAYYEFPPPAEIHDVAVVSVVPSATEVHLGQTVNITAVVKNEGTVTETFNVTAYASHQILEFIVAIQTQPVINLPPDNQTTLIFSWNTTDVTLGNYTISAEASVVHGETYATDNVKVNGTVNVIPEFVSTLLLFVVFVATMTLSMLMKRKLTSQGSSSKTSCETQT